MMNFVGSDDVSDTNISNINVGINFNIDVHVRLSANVGFDKDPEWLVETAKRMTMMI